MRKYGMNYIEIPNLFIRKILRDIWLIFRQVAKYQVIFVQVAKYQVIFMQLDKYQAKYLELLSC